MLNPIKLQSSQIMSRFDMKEINVKAVGFALIDLHLLVCLCRPYISQQSDGKEQTTSVSMASKRT